MFLTSLGKREAGNDGWGVCVLALALADRYLLKRKDITHLELGDVEIKPVSSGAVQIPSKFPFCAAQRSDIGFRDVQKPTTVIEGETTLFDVG
ncbi:hypothetical protein MS6207_03952 [Escherichia coli]|uniref:hypothetical protein n=1 Tax=Escherichia coli TaxID=562 RepID=UPI0017DED6C6|nr:hypothetical protein [Escherichia coli]NUV19718.1 hypothetical protein [Escherichia coli]